MTTPPSSSALIEKIQKLPSHRLAEVEDFVDFLAVRNRDIAAPVRLSDASFRAVWDNADDAEYDRL